MQGILKGSKWAKYEQIWVLTKMKKDSNAKCAGCRHAQMIKDLYHPFSYLEMPPKLISLNPDASFTESEIQIIKNRKILK